jgi:prolyl-tRNA synthetase
VKFDDRETHKPGWKFAEYELKGVPVRIAIGPRDLENNSVEVARRDTMEKSTYQMVDLDIKISHLLENIQKNIYTKANEFRHESMHKADSWDEFVDLIENKGGFVLAHWDGTTETEQQIKEKTKATIRCIPMDEELKDGPGSCILTGKPSKGRVVFARAY